MDKTSVAGFIMTHSVVDCGTILSFERSNKTSFFAVCCSSYSQIKIMKYYINQNFKQMNLLIFLLTNNRKG